MSRSKRVAPIEIAPKPPRKAPPGLRLTLAARLYLVLTAALRLGLGAALRALFEVWNVNPNTVARAPGWAGALYLWQGSLVTLMVSLAAIALTVRLFRVSIPGPESKPTLLWYLMGTALALGSAGLFLLTDSLRLEWPLPRLSPGLLPLWLLSLVSILAEELFTKGVLLENVRRPWGLVLSALAFFLANGGASGTVISGVNVALLGLACGLIYLRRGLWADVAFRWGWSFATVFLLGQGGGDHSVFKLYGVSEVLLTGGDPGFVYGLWMTALLIIISLVTWKRGSKP